MSDLVKRLRDGCNLQQRDGERAADSIEELERELAAEVENNKGEFESRTEAERKVRALTGQLAAEKALADSLHFALTNTESADINAVFYAYRRARGL